MAPLNDPIEACPRCKSTHRVKSKLVLIDPPDPAREGDARRVGCSCAADLSVTDLKPEFAESVVSAQFIQGLYCELCGIGFVPEFMAKPLKAKFIAVPGGWRRVHEDGTQGSLLERMADDPEC